MGPTRLPLKGSAWAPSVCSGLRPRRVRNRTRNYLKRLLTKVLPRTRSTELGLKAKMRRVRAPVIPKGWWPSPKALQAHTLSCPTYPLGRRAEDLDSCAPPPPIAQQPTLVRPPRSVRPVVVLPLASAPPPPPPDLGLKPFGLAVPPPVPGEASRGWRTLHTTFHPSHPAWPPLLLIRVREAASTYRCLPTLLAGSTRRLRDELVHYRRLPC